jgi:hypothetical protein
MTRTSRHLIGGLTLAALIAVWPAATSIGASSPKELPLTQVNRAAKGDRLVEPSTIAVKKPGTQRPIPIEQSDKRQIMDGCESAFSPVTTPSMAHVAGRCIG